MGVGQVNRRTAGDGIEMKMGRSPGWMFLGAFEAVFFPGIRESFCSGTVAWTLALSATRASRFDSLQGIVAGHLRMRLAHGSQDVPLESLDCV